MPARPQDDKHDKAVEDSFPASDPTSGIVGPKTDRHDDSRPKGSDDRHLTETEHKALAQE